MSSRDAPNATVPREPTSDIRTRLETLALVVVGFTVALSLSHVLIGIVSELFSVDEPGTLSRLLAGILALQVVGFGGVVGVFLWLGNEPWRSELRLGPVSEWVVFYGTVVGLALMVVASLATGLFRLLDVEPAESAVGVAQDPLFYVVLFVVSTVVVVPLEEVFFRGFVQRRLERSFHAGVAICVASLFFMLVHTGISVGTGGEALALGLFFSLGVVLGVGYHATGNLFVPVLGHALFNGVQILVRTIEVLA